MKILIPALCLLLSLSACQKEINLQVDNSTTNTTNTTSGSFQAKINGKLWVADKGAAAQFVPTTNGLPALISIVGLGKDKKTIGMTLIDSGVHQYTLPDGLAATGLYNVGVFQDSALASPFAFSSNAALSANAPSGTVKITTINKTDKTISGTFSFNAYRSVDNDQRTITEGVFTNIPYTEGAGLPAASSKDTFNVKVNGTLFTPYSITGLKTNTGVSNVIAIIANSQSLSQTVGLTFPANITPGSYTLDIYGGTYLAQYNVGTTYLGASSGTLQILEHNTTTKRIRGNFNFKAEAILTTDNAQLSDGYFSVTYQ